MLDDSIPSAPAHGTVSSLAEQTLPRGFPAHEQRECCFPPSPVGPRIIKNGTNELWGKVFLSRIFASNDIWYLQPLQYGRMDNLQDLSWK